MLLCSLYNTFNQINPNEIVVSKAVAKTAICCIERERQILYIVYFMMSILNLVHFTDCMLIFVH
jgi:hypothetical protein